MKNILYQYIYLLYMIYICTYLEEKKNTKKILKRYLKSIINRRYLLLIDILNLILIYVLLGNLN